VQFNAAPVPAVTTDDVHPPYAPTQSVTQLLNRLPGSSVQMVGSGLINGTIGGTYPIYTVPANMTLLPTEILFVLTGISGSGIPPAVSIGFSGSFHNLIDSTRTTAYALTGGSIFAPGEGYLVGDQIVLAWGAVQPVLTVEAINGDGAVTAYDISNPGSSAIQSTDPINSTSVRTSIYGEQLYGTGPYGGGHGSGFLFNATWSVLTNPLGTTLGGVASITDFASTAGQSGAGFQYINGGETVTARVDEPATFAAYTLDVLIFGPLIGFMPAAVLPGSQFGKGSYGLRLYGVA
jgi:hypothetical protein